MQSNSSRRRFLAVGSAATVFASLHGAIAQAEAPAALAGAVSTADPVFAALADLERVKANVETVGKIHAVAEEAIYEAGAPGLVEFDGAQIRRLAHLDAVFKSSVTPRKAVLSIIQDMRANLPPRLSPAGRAARNAARAEAYRNAHAELERIVAAEAEASAQSGFDEAEAKWNEAVSRENEAEDAVLALTLASQPARWPCCASSPRMAAPMPWGRKRQPLFFALSRYSSGRRDHGDAKTSRMGEADHSGPRALRARRGRP